MQPRHLGPGQHFIIFHFISSVLARATRDTTSTKLQSQTMHRIRALPPPSTALTVYSPQLLLLCPAYPQPFKRRNICARVIRALIYKFNPLRTVPLLATNALTHVQHAPISSESSIPYEPTVPFYFPASYSPAFYILCSLNIFAEELPFPPYPSVAFMQPSRIYSLCLNCNLALETLSLASVSPVRPYHYPR